MYTWNACLVLSTEQNSLKDSGQSYMQELCSVLYNIWDVAEKKSPYRDWGINFGGTYCSLYQLVWYYSLHFYWSLLLFAYFLCNSSHHFAMSFLYGLCKSTFMTKFRLSSPWHPSSFRSGFCVSHRVFWKREGVSYAIFHICKSSKDRILCTLDGKHTASLLRT